MLGRLNLSKKSQSGGGTSLNVFAQSIEPETKDGIWINTSATGNLPAIDNFEYEGIEISNSDTYIQLDNMPYDYHQRCAICSIGTDIYLFGGENNSVVAYKFDTLTNTYTQIADMPKYFSCDASVVAVGTDIYLFGFGTDVNPSAKNKAYKYDTLTDTYTQIADNSNYSGMKSIALYNNKIYMFGYYQSTSYSLGAKYYDIANNTYTNIRDLPGGGGSCAAVTAGDKIYIFGSANNNYRDRAFMYDPNTNSYSSLKNMPLLDLLPIAVGNNIYLLGGYRYTRQIYKYDPSINDYIRLTDIPYDFIGGNVANIGGYLYLFGSNANSEYYRYSYRYTIEARLYNNLVCINSSNDDNKVKLTDNLLMPVNKAYLVVDGTSKSYPAYYGDSTQWNAIS